MHRHSTQHTRHQRERWIDRRVRLLDRIWCGGFPSEWPRGKVAKWNTSCNCWMCDDQRHRDTRPRTIQAEIAMREQVAEVNGHAAMA